MFLIKLPFRIAALPIVAALAIIQVVTAILTGISSIFTNLLGMICIGTAACMRAFQLGINQDAYWMLTVGILFIVLPHIAGWVVSKIADACTRLIAFIVP